MKVFAGGIVPILMLVLAPSSSLAQQRIMAFADAPVGAVAPIAAPSVQIQQGPTDELKPEEQMSTSGFFLGIIGMIGGAVVGSQIGQGACPSRSVDEQCMGRHAYTGALVAGTVFVPLGVHIANKNRKNLPLVMAISALTGTASYFAMKAIPGEPIAMAPFVAAPLQVVTSVRLERI